MTIQFSFDLRSLPDRVLNLLIRGSGEGDRPKTALVRSVAELLTEEKFLRRHGSRAQQGPHIVETGIVAGDVDGIRVALANLQRDVADLEFAASQSAPVEAAELEVAANFLCVIAESLKQLQKSEYVS